MKKIATKLMISVLSVALAFIALGTSTFAWFSMNTEVTASGMTLQAATPVNLLISNAQNGTYANTATPNEASLTGKLLPASSAAGVTFNAIQENQSLDNTEEGDSLGGVVAVSGINSGVKFQPTASVVAMNGANDGYYTSYDYWLELSEEVENTYAYLASLKVLATKTLTSGTITAEGKLDGQGDTVYYKDMNGTLATAGPISESTTVYYETALTNCVRVAVYEGTSAGTLLGIYAIAGANDSYSAVTATMVESTKETVSEAADLTAMTLVDHTTTRTKGAYFNAAANGSLTAPENSDVANSIYVTTALSKTPKQITLVVWLEGQDNQCINANAGVQFSISVSFKTWTKTA